MIGQQNLWLVNKIYDWSTKLKLWIDGSYDLNDDENNLSASQTKINSIEFNQKTLVDSPQLNSIQLNVECLLEWLSSLANSLEQLVECSLLLAVSVHSVSAIPNPNPSLDISFPLSGFMLILYSFKKLSLFNADSVA